MMDESRRGIVQAVRVLLIVALCVFPIALTGCPDRTPPGLVSSFTATSGDGQVVLAWINPTNRDLVGVKIQRKVGSVPTSQSDGTEVFNGAGTGHTDTTAVNGTTYYYAAFAYDAAANFSAGVTAGPVTPTFASASTEILGSLGVLHAELAGPDPLPAPERAVLEGALSEAESLYRGGQGCEAGALLASDFLPKAQEFRTGATLATAERLYNMARMLRYDILGSELLKANCDGAARIGLPADAEANNPANDVSQLLTSAVFGEPRTATVEDPLSGEVFTQIHLPDAESDSGEPGLPAVPIIRRLVAIPQDATFELLMTTPVVAETIHCNLVPSQPQPVDAGGPLKGFMPPDEVFANLPFEKNVEAYATDALYPQEVVQAHEIGGGRDVRFLLLEIAGGQFNPKTNVLTLFNNVPVEVAFKGGTYIGSAQGSSPFEPATPVLSGTLLNKGLFLRPELLKPFPSRFEIYGEEFLILTHPSFRAAADRLAVWKREKGIATRVYECGTGSGIAGRQTREEIDAFIQSHWGSVLVRPSYILLFGDAEFISPFYLNDIGTDWPYAVLGNPGLVSVPDFAVGRIPVDTIEQANAVVDKIIAYEKTPPINSDFYKNASVASFFQCCRDDVSWPGTDQRTFIEVSEFARNVMLGKGKTVQRIYTKNVSTVPARYFDGTFLPSDLGTTSGFSWNGNTGDIVTALNAGRFLAIHRDHGWDGGWGDPGFGTGNALALTNGALTPVVFSVNCASGYFDNETAPGGSFGSTYFAEEFLRKANGGAVGILGDTRNSPSWPNTALLKGFIDAMWPNAIGSFGNSTSKRRLGDILNHGKLYMTTQIGVASAGVSSGDARDELYLWHCYGDPTLEIWLSDPNVHTLPAGLLSAVLLNESLSVGYGVNGALITALQEDPQNPGVPRIIGRGTVEGGVAILPYIEIPLPRVPILYSAAVEDAVVVAPTLVQ